MRKHLNICIQIEKTVAQIYRKMAESSKLSPAVRTGLLELAQEEDDHASQLQFALRFPDGSIVDSLPGMLQEAERLLQLAQKALQHVEQNVVSDQQAVNIGVELEKKFCQAHIGNSFQFKEEHLKSMFSAMAKDDERHCKKLEELKKQCQP
ncbi:Rubrerythrin [Malonomonas rubra DSM 5091]|uniref:Rubrerythrin n=1 Tax=Malonomonas rubra DSM 5091 TaxID=1122189 RepID=A0A1M6GEF7_MALRU|nr:hypothetical protein [Malonomonas rubra]SHJ08335.1 Rubrerythrin [Malonomonas rubra DSM 5091]